MVTGGGETPPFLRGMQLGELTPELRDRLEVPGDVDGVLIRRVDPGSAADQAGLKTGDVVVEVDRQPVQGVRDLYRIARRAKKRNLLLYVWSQGTSGYVVVRNDD